MARHPGEQGRRELPRARPLPGGHVMDPRRHGSEPPRPNGAPAGRVWQNAHGRVLPPGREHVRVFDDYHGNVRVVVNGWDRDDHGYRWYDWGGYRVAHHYDEFGFHWFGWYVGGVYFWTRYYNDLFWWYDPYWHRWCYFRDGHWWWQDPDNAEVVYIYSGESYYRYEPTTGGVVMTPDPTPPVDAPPAEDQPAPPADGAKVYCSQDGSRCVDVSGDEARAYLRDTADPPAFEPVLLDSGVSDVRFRLDGDGRLEQILLLKGDGSFVLFDPQGVPADGGQAAPPSNNGAPLDLNSFIRRSPTFDLLRGLDPSH